MIVRGLRWWIIGLVCSGLVTNYLARNSLGVMAATLMQDMHFSTQQYSYIVGAFQIAYTVMQPVCGFVLDRLGVHLGFFLFALAWSISNGLHAFAGGWVALAVCRGFVGLAESAGIPAGIKVVSEWLPARERSVGVGMINIGTSFGAMLAPPLVVAIELNYDWSTAFLVTGAMGLVFAIAWWFLYRAPEQHPSLGAPEREMIAAGRAKFERTADGAIKKPDIRAMLGSRKFWGIALPRFLAEPTWQTFNFWVPLYLSTQRGMNLKEMAMFAWMPFLAADLGSLAGGFLSPFFMKYFKMRLLDARLAGLVVGATLMIGPGCIGLVASPYTAIALLCVGGFAHQVISSSMNTLGTDLYGRHEVATANGFAGMVSWTGGLSFSLVVGALATVIGYDPLFACLSVFDILGAVIAVSFLRRYATSIDAEIP